MWMISKYYSSDVQLEGKTVLITGANTGIGKATVEELYKRGARVLMACRSEEKANVAIKEIKTNTMKETAVGNLVFLQLDLASFNSIRKCAELVMKKENRIDILINNAGIYCCPEGKTEDGFETQFGVNHLGHFLLTLLLLPKMIKSEQSKIINVASNFHKAADLQFDDLNYKKRSYSAIKAYNTSKLCNILFTRELARRLEEKKITNVKVYAPHPGFVYTEIPRYLDSAYGYGTYYLWRLFVGWWLMTPKQGAQTTLYCALDERASKESGLYYNNCKSETPAKNARSDENAQKLWEISIDYCNLKGYNPFGK